MLLEEIDKSIKTYPDFPEKGIFFRDIMPIFSKPELFSELIENMASAPIFKDVEAIIAIDARGFLFASGIALKLGIPMIVARKPGKLPGHLITKSYELEYGSNSLSMQIESLKPFQKYAIVDDLLATGGTVQCVSNIVKSLGKEVLGLLVVIELSKLNGTLKLDFPVFSQISY